MKYLLDTCTCIDLFKGSRKVYEKIKSIGRSNIFISEITVAELYFGAFKSNNLKHFNEVEQCMRFFEVIPITSSIKTYAKTRAQLEASGFRIDDLDLFIASTALENDMKVVTSNTKHFFRVPGIKLEDWREE